MDNPFEVMPNEEPKDISLDEFLKLLRTRVDRFEKFYRDGMNTPPPGYDATLEGKMWPGDWFEQFITWEPDDQR